MVYGTEKAIFHSSAAFPASLYCLKEYTSSPIPHMKDEMQDASTNSRMSMKMSETDMRMEMANVYFLICSPCARSH